MMGRVRMEISSAMVRRGVWGSEATVQPLRATLRGEDFSAA